MTYHRPIRRQEEILPCEELLLGEPSGWQIVRGLPSTFWRELVAYDREAPCRARCMIAVWVLGFAMILAAFANWLVPAGGGM